MRASRADPGEQYASLPRQDYAYSAITTGTPELCSLSLTRCARYRHAITKPAPATAGRYIAAVAPMLPDHSLGKPCRLSAELGRTVYGCSRLSRSDGRLSPWETICQAQAFCRHRFPKSQADAQTQYLRSVSYTHLRAHETPEHLVCRLL